VTHPDDLDPYDAYALDPDLVDVPPELVALNGQQVSTVEPDGTTTTSTLLVVPGLWGHARRYRESGGAV
jgi:hypothetical protein